MMGSGMRIVIIFGVIISGAVLAIVIFLNSNIINGLRESRNEKKERIEEELRKMVEKHLENKYGEGFIVEKGFHGTAAVDPLPFPKETNAPWYCVSYAESDLNFGFRVYIYPESIEKKRDVNNIGKISDSYWEKFFRELIREELESRIDKVILQDYKLVVSVDYRIPFSNEINQNSSIEEYIKLPEKECSFSLNFISNENEETLRDKLYKILEEYDKRLEGKINFDFTAYKTKSQEDFITFNVKEVEGVNLEGLRGIVNYSADEPRWWTDLEELFVIDDFKKH